MSNRTIYLYTILDLKAEAAILPFAREKDAVAIRAFQLTLENPQEAMSNNPQDYELYKIGSYDDETMHLTEMSPVRLITGREAVKERKQDLDTIAALQAQIQELQGEVHSLTNGVDNA